MHQTLEKQLQALSLAPDEMPDRAQWQALLEAVSTSYAQAPAGPGAQQQLEERVRAILGALSDLLVLVDDQGRYLEVLAGSGDLLLAPVEQLQGRYMDELLPEDLARYFVAAIHAAIASQQLQTVEYTLDGEAGERLFEGRVLPAGFEVDGRPAVLFLSRDITHMQDSDRNARLLETVIQAAREGVAIISESRKVLYANPAVGEITGFSPQELMREGEGFLRHELDHRLCQQICSEARRGDHWQQEIELHTKSGETRLVWLSLDTLRTRSGEIEYFVALLNDVTDIRRSRAQLEHVATHDSLTGLPNRALFESRLGQALSRARRHDTRGAVLLLDLDRFKQVNDSLGHSVGDGLLIEVAKRLQRASRQEDMVARLGGDEFTLILEDLDEGEQAAMVADKILEVFSHPMLIEGLELEVATSIGIATFPAEGETIDDLLKQADAAMYDAKESGGNQYRYHSPELSETAINNISLQAELRAALTAGQLQVVYQPQFTLDAGELVGFEALLRWPQADGSMRMPEEFIHVAEVSGLIEPLGLWVFEEVCRQAVRWQQQGVDYGRLSINVSGRQLVNPKFAASVSGLLDRYGIAGSHLEVEITESMVIHEGDMRHRNLDELHALGIQLAIDDFGTGHSSLVNLKRFPLKRLKIDRSFILDVGRDPNDEAIVGATIALGKELGLEVVAEGVESEYQVGFLRDLYCDVVQGFLFAAPMTPQQVSEAFPRLNRRGI